MYLEYLYNNDTQQMCEEVCRLAQNEEPKLFARCQEVSHQTDTSSLDAKVDCVAKINNIRAVLANMEAIFEHLAQSLSVELGVFRTRDGQADFGMVCRAVTEIEEGRAHLISSITELTQVRKTIFESVANANRALHFLKTAKRAVGEEAKAKYSNLIDITEGAYARLAKLDAAIREVQPFYMTLVERYIPAFMERLRASADFNHAGAALERGAVCALCKEVFLLTNQAPNITF